MRNLARVVLVAAGLSVLPTAQAEAIDCGLLRPVCGVVCRTTYDTFGWPCFA